MNNKIKGLPDNYQLVKNIYQFIRIWNDKITGEFNEGEITFTNDGKRFKYTINDNLQIAKGDEVSELVAAFKALKEIDGVVLFKPEDISDYPNQEDNYSEDEEENAPTPQKRGSYKLNLKKRLRVPVQQEDAPTPQKRGSYKLNLKKRLRVPAQEEEQNESYLSIKEKSNLNIYKFLYKCLNDNLIKFFHQNDKFYIDENGREYYIVESIPLENLAFIEKENDLEFFEKENKIDKKEIGDFFYHQLEISYSKYNVRALDIKDKDGNLDFKKFIQYLIEIYPDKKESFYIKNKYLTKEKYFKSSYFKDGFINFCKKNNYREIYIAKLFLEYVYFIDFIKNKIATLDARKGQPYNRQRFRFGEAIDNNHGKVVTQSIFYGNRLVGTLFQYNGNILKDIEYRVESLDSETLFFDDEDSFDEKKYINKLKEVIKELPIKSELYEDEGGYCILTEKFTDIDIAEKIAFILYKNNLFYEIDEDFDTRNYKPEYDSGSNANRGKYKLINRRRKR